MIERSAGWGTGEAMSAGRIEVGGTCALGTGAAMRGGTIVVRGNCGPRTAANMKGGTLIVEGSVGYLAGFMTHAGDLIVCGDAGEALGDSLWAGNIWVAGTIAGLGADAMVVGDHGRGVRPPARAAPAGGHRRDVRFQARDRRAEALVLQRARPGGLAEDMSENHGYTDGRSHIWTTETIRDIHAKAELGRYQIRGFSTFRKFPSWDDLVFLPAVMTRLPLEGYREHCETKTVIGGGKPDLVARPLELDIPVYLTSMSFGASAPTPRWRSARASPRPAPPRPPARAACSTASAPSPRS